MIIQGESWEMDDLKKEKNLQIF